LQRQSRSKDDKSGPQDIGAQEVCNLQPHWGQHHYIEHAQHILSGKQDQHKR
jgi:hypothetical protein